MTTIQIIRRRVKDPKSGKIKHVRDLRLKRKGRITLVTLQGYARRKDAVDMMLGHIRDFRNNRVRWKGFVAALLLVALALLPSHLALAINSPRPASYRLQGGALVLTWTNLNTAYPRTLSYRPSLSAPWQWESDRLWPDATGTLVVTRPIAGPAMFYRLWPAAP